MAYLTAKQVRDEFGYARSTLLRWESQGQIKSYRTKGGQRRYNAEDFKELSPNTPSPGLGETKSSTTPGPTNGAGPHNAAFANPMPTQVPSSGYYDLGGPGLTRWVPGLFTEKIPELRGTQGYELLHEMRVNDPVIAACFMVIENALKQAPWRVIPASELEADLEAAEFVEQCLHDLSYSWLDQLSFILDMLEFGVSVLEIVYKRRLGPEPPAYVPDPGKSAYNDGRVGWRKWAPRHVMTINPDNGWDMDDSGTLRGVEQYLLNGKHTYIPIEKLLLFRTTVNPANSPHGMPIHRPMYTSWWYSMNLMEIEGIGIERDLNGIPVIYLGDDCTVTGVNSDYELAKQLGTHLRRDEQACVVIPKPKLGTAGPGKGMLIELMSSTSRRTYDTNQILERYDRRKAVAVLAQFIMLGMNQVGSYALSKHQGDLFSLAAGAWLDSIADVINRIAIPRLFRYNNFPGITGFPKARPADVGFPKLTEIADYVNKLVGAKVLHADQELERHLRQLADLPPRDTQASPEEVTPEARDLGSSEPLATEPEQTTAEDVAPQPNLQQGIIPKLPLMIDDDEDEED